MARQARRGRATQGTAHILHPSPSLQKYSPRRTIPLDSLYSVTYNLSMERRITTSEAAAELHVSRRRVQALIKSGRLAAERVGRDWLIEERALRQMRPRKVGRPRKDKAGRPAGGRDEHSKRPALL